jgi:hypothetical protein
MYSESFQQFVIVQGDTAQQLTEKLNAELYRLRHKRPAVTFEGLIARISYEEETSEPEDLRDEYEAVGVHLTCQDCPYFEPILKADGTEDKRNKWGDCEFANYGRTSRNSKPCDLLFQRINSGEVRLCVAD